ncbi:MAG: S-layer homology domain-containing protein, partial [Clostridia bacterium]|nr:S-layer homology domain-containing protein [Clostridia bacterium]
MKQNRIWSMMLVVLMLTTMILPVQAAAAPTVTLTSGEAKPGEVIMLTASITDNPGLATYQLYFYYDTSVFEIESLRASGSFAQSGNILVNSIAVAEDRGRYDGQAGKDGTLGLWFNNIGMNEANSGEMAMICLRIKDGAAAGNYTIGLDYSKANTINENSEKVALKTSGGTVTVLSDGSNGSAKPEQSQPDKGTEEAPVVIDVAGNWAEEYILECAARGLVNGKSAGIFDPNANMTRAEFVTILWRAMGSPAPKGKATFTDL